MSCSLESLNTEYSEPLKDGGLRRSDDLNLMIGPSKSTKPIKNDRHVIMPFGICKANHGM